MGGYIYRYTPPRRYAPVSNPVCACLHCFVTVLSVLVLCWRVDGDQLVNNSAADCSISLKFGTEFDHVTADTLNATNVQGQRVRGQGRSVTLRIGSKKG